jgi:4-alpha-glucanotransferase
LLAVATDRFGIDDRYFDALGKEHHTSRETRAAILAAMGVEPGPTADEGDDALAAEAEGAPRGSEVLMVRAGAGGAVAVQAPGRLTLEDGTVLSVERALPPDLPPGYHHLQARAGGGETLVIVTPGVCHLPDDLRTWGWAAQLYAARSRDSWGIGDLADLRRLGRWSREALGAGVVMVNPLTAATPVHPVEASPYYPSSRRYRNPLFLRVEEVPGAAEVGRVGVDLQRLAQAGRALNAERRIDRDAVMRLKMQALEAIFDLFTGDERFDAYWREQGDSLTQFSAYCALAERHGRDWRRWPAGLRRPDGAEVAEFIRDSAPRVRFHAWLQWLIDEQLRAASAEIRVVHDLPIGLDVAGADAWCWQDLMADGISVGAPPDEFAAGGQDWGLTPFIPHKLRAARYRPFIETIRAMLRHAGGLRIDHVMGLFRLFWIPRALGAARGTYVRYAADELMGIVALESQRAKAFIVGEDLGTVEDGVRETLAEHKMLSYRLLYFEPVPPPKFPELALSGVTTHDLPTVAGLWSGGDVAGSRAAGITPNEPGMKALREKLSIEAHIPHDAPNDEAIEKTHRALAAAPSRVLLATLDDALAVVERPNMPGTTTAWPNWSLALPIPLEDIEETSLPRRLAAVLSRSGASSAASGAAEGGDAEPDDAAAAQSIA